MAPFGLAYSLYLRTPFTLDPPNGSLSFQTPVPGSFRMQRFSDSDLYKKLQSHFYEHTFTPQFVLESST